MSLNNVDSSNGYLEATATDGIAISEAITQDTGPDIISSSASNEFTTFSVVNVGDDLVIKKLDDTTHELSVVNVDQNPISIKESVTMTSYTNAEGFIVTVSSASNPGVYDGFDAFNDTSDISNNFWRSNGAGAGNWIAMEFPVAKIINNIDINGYRDGASSSTLLGCDVHGWDGSAYVLLGSFTFSPVWANYEIRNISFANSTAYIKYKITGTSVNNWYFVSSYVAFLYNGDGYTVDTTSITAGEIPQAVYELSGYDNAFSSVKNIQSKEEYANISEAIVADTLVTSSPIVDGDNLVIVKDDDSIHEVVASGVVSLEDNLVAFYPLNVDSSDCTGAYDGVSTGVDFNGNVASFDGVDDSIDTNLKLNAFDTRTFSFWLRVTNTNHQTLITYGYNGDGSIGDNDRKLVFIQLYLGELLITGSYNGGTYPTGYSPPLNTLVHCTITQDGNDFLVYINGALVASTPIALDLLTSTELENSFIGSRIDSTIFFGGALSNFRIYSDVKDQVFIDNLYAEGVYTPSCANYSMDTTAVTAGEIPSKVFTVDSKVAFDDGTGFVYPSELGNDYLAVEGEVPAPDLTPGLVAHYLLNNNADDSHGVYDGTSVGGVDLQGDVAYFNKGIGTQITIPSILGIETVSLWCSFDNTTATDYKTIISMNDTGGTYTSMVNWGAGVAWRFYVSDLGWIDFVIDSSTLTIDRMYHVLVTKVGGIYYGYLDGVLVGQVASTALINIKGFGHHIVEERNHKGNISNVRFYSDNKDQTFIDDLFEEGYYPKPLPLPTTDGLLAHYPLTGTTEDSTGTYDSTEVSATYKDDAKFGSVYDGGGSITVNTSATALANWCCYWLESGSGWTFTKTTTIPSSLTTNDYRNLRLYSATPSTALQDEIEAYEKNFRPIDIDDGLVAYYPLANNSLDNYYNGYDGVDSAGVTYDGVKASYSSLNRTSLGLNTLPHLTQYTFSFWALRLSAVTDTNLVFTLYRRWSSTSSYRSGIAIEILDSGTLRFFIHNSTDNYSGSTSISVDTLHHVAITYDNGTVEMFIDNQKVYNAYMAVVGWSSAGPSDDSIGGYTTQVGQIYSYTGDISKFRVYNKAITAEQVAIIYNTEKGDFI